MFNGIVGNGRAIALLEKDLERKSFSHAYIFSGPANVGKTTVALRFATHVMCGCGDCHDCVLLERGSHPDLKILSGTESIKIEEARELQRFLGLKPYQSKRRVVIVENAERMTREAANSLLKVLEEPSGNSVMILTSTEKRDLLTTVLSRCRLINFTLVADNDILALSKSRGITLDKNDYFFKGKPGILVNSLSEEGLYENAREIFGLLPSFFKKGGYKKKFDLVKKMAESPELMLVLDSFSLIFRDILLCKNHCKEEIMSFEIKNFKTENIQEILAMIEKIKKNINKGVNTKLSLENLILKMEGV